MKIKASNNNFWVIREIPDAEKGGILIPDSAKKTTHKGKIISMGKLVNDPAAKEGLIAIFNKSAGFDITEEGITYTILNQGEIVGYI